MKRHYISFSLRTVLVLMCLLLAARPVTAAQGRAAIYYVATNGNDSNPGTLEQPWRTLDKAAATLEAGDTLYIRAGTYYEQLKPAHDGAAGAWITFAAYPGETVTLDGRHIDLNDWGGLVDLSHRQYIRVQGLRVVNSTYAGIFSDYGAYLEVLDSFSSNTASSGIATWHADQVTIRGNEVEYACTSLGQEAITIAETSNFLVEGNDVHDSGSNANGGEGIDVKGGSHDGVLRGNHIHDTLKMGLYVDAYHKHTYNILVTGNYIHDVAEYGMGLASEAGGLLENVTVSNNLVYHNKYAGLGFHNCCSDTHPVHDVLVINNTFAYNGWGTWGPALDISNPDLEGLVVRNNLMALNTFSQIEIVGVPMGRLTIDHNLIYGDQDDPGQVGTAAVLSDPQLVNLAGGDLHLRTTSPAIDAGSNALAPANSVEGTSRPQDGNQDGMAQVDIGAYEVATVAPVTPNYRLYLAVTVR